MHTFFSILLFPIIIFDRVNIKSLVLFRSISLYLIFNFFVLAQEVSFLWLFRIVNLILILHYNKSYILKLMIYMNISNCSMYNYNLFSKSFCNLYKQQPLNLRRLSIYYYYIEKCVNIIII